MYNANEYNNDTTERDARDAQEARESERDSRMEACDAGLVSYRAAVAGGELYAAEFMDSISRAWVSAVAVGFVPAAMPVSFQEAA